MRVFWHHNCLIQTVYMQSDIGRVLKPSGFNSKFHLDGMGSTTLTREEDDRASDGFDTRAEAKRFLESVAKRLGAVLITRHIGWAEYMASYTAQM